MRDVAFRDKFINSSNRSKVPDLNRFESSSYCLLHEHMNRAVGSSYEDSRTRNVGDIMNELHFPLRYRNPFYFVVRGAEKIQWPNLTGARHRYSFPVNLRLYYTYLYGISKMVELRSN